MRHHLMRKPGALFLGKLVFPRGPGAAPQVCRLVEAHIPDSMLETVIYTRDDGIVD